MKTVPRPAIDRAVENNVETVPCCDDRSTQHTRERSKPCQALMLTLCCTLVWLRPISPANSHKLAHRQAWKSLPRPAGNVKPAERAHRPPKPHLEDSGSQSHVVTLQRTRHRPRHPTSTAGSRRRALPSPPHTTPWCGHTTQWCGHATRHHHDPMHVPYTHVAAPECAVRHSSQPPHQKVPVGPPCIEKTGPHAVASRIPLRSPFPLWAAALLSTSLARGATNRAALTAALLSTSLATGAMNQAACTAPVNGCCRGTAGAPTPSPVAWLQPANGRCTWRRPESRAASTSSRTPRNQTHAPPPPPRLLSLCRAKAASAALAVRCKGRLGCCHCAVQRPPRLLSLCGAKAASAALAVQHAKAGSHCAACKGRLGCCHCAACKGRLSRAAGSPLPMHTFGGILERQPAKGGCRQRPPAASLPVRARAGGGNQTQAPLPPPLPPPPPVPTPSPPRHCTGPRQPPPPRSLQRAAFKGHGAHAPSTQAPSARRPPPPAAAAPAAVLTGNSQAGHAGMRLATFINHAAPNPPQLPPSPEGTGGVYICTYVHATQPPPGPEEHPKLCKYARCKHAHWPRSMRLLGVARDARGAQGNQRCGTATGQRRNALARQPGRASNL
eukprot:360246-Chlamydomonas_euryale.AAC.3